MTPNIEQVARACRNELPALGEYCTPRNSEDYLEIITRHLTTHTKDLEEEVKRLREALRAIKLYCLTSRDRPQRMFIHAVRLCRDAGITEDYTELQALTKPKCKS